MTTVAGKPKGFNSLKPCVCAITVVMLSAMAACVMGSMGTVLQAVRQTRARAVKNRRVKIEYL
jgi:hypothetical protein